MITAFGKFLRILRMDNNEILKNMADKLNVTSSFLSAVENGKKKIPSDWSEKISNLYSLSQIKKTELENAISETNNCIEIGLSNLNVQQRELAFSFARKINGFDDNELNKLWQILKEEYIMKKEEKNKLINTISIINTQKLNQISRAGYMLTLGFGELIKNNAAYKNEDGTFEIKKIYTPKYALHIDCPFRITCGDNILITKNDIFIANSELRKKTDFNEDNFDFDNVGDSSFDEKINKYFADSSIEFFVHKIEVNKFGDLKIFLTDNFCIEAIIDSSENEECWRFFEAGNANKPHTVVFGNGFFEE